MSFRIACKMNLEKLPFDTQSCGLLAGLYSQRAEQVQLRWRDPAKYEALANWEGACRIQSRAHLYGEGFFSFVANPNM